jgi:hypothetical protein
LICKKAKPEDYTILVDDLRKVYQTGKVGVDKISVGIKIGEVLLIF